MNSLRILILANDDLTSSVILSPLLEETSIDVVGVVFPQAPTSNGTGQLSGALELLEKVTIRYWLYLVFVNGFFKIFEKLTAAFGSHARHGVLVSIRSLAERANIPVRIESDFGSREFLTFVTNTKPDLVITRAGAILSAEFLEIPNYGTWCVHSSLLPSFGGIAGEFHALRHTGAEIGTTVFLVSPELDKGPPLKQARCKRDECRSLHNHILRNNSIASDLLIETVREFMRDGEVTPDLCNKILKRSYFSWPKNAHMKSFRVKGGKLITFREILGYVLSSFRLKRLNIEI